MKFHNPKMSLSKAVYQLWGSWQVQIRDSLLTEWSSVDYVSYHIYIPPIWLEGRGRSKKPPFDICFTNIFCYEYIMFHCVQFVQDGTFKLTMEFSEEYPNKPPVVKFLSKMFHPNIYADGGICLDILQNRW